ncbi:hypothetical protein SNEBB_005388 [Seison nebaliae]|nr:hypothetical protein SNEBB_005388 [Seison nebaliae]
MNTAPYVTLPTIQIDQLPANATIRTFPKHLVIPIGTTKSNPIIPQSLYAPPPPLTSKTTTNATHIKTNHSNDVMSKWKRSTSTSSPSTSSIRLLNESNIQRLFPTTIVETPLSQIDKRSENKLKSSSASSIDTTDKHSTRIKSGSIISENLSSNNNKQLDLITFNKKNNFINGNSDYNRLPPILETSETESIQSATNMQPTSQVVDLNGKQYRVVSIKSSNDGEVEDHSRMKNNPNSLTLSTLPQNEDKQVNLNVLSKFTHSQVQQSQILEEQKRLIVDTNEKLKFIRQRDNLQQKHIRKLEKEKQMILNAFQNLNTNLMDNNLNDTTDDDDENYLYGFNQNQTNGYYLGDNYAKSNSFVEYNPNRSILNHSFNDDFNMENPYKFKKYSKKSSKRYKSNVTPKVEYSIKLPNGERLKDKEAQRLIRSMESAIRQSNNRKMEIEELNDDSFKSNDTKHSHSTIVEEVSSNIRTAFRPSTDNSLLNDMNEKEKVKHEKKTMVDSRERKIIDENTIVEQQRTIFTKNELEPEDMSTLGDDVIQRYNAQINNTFDSSSALYRSLPNRRRRRRQKHQEKEDNLEKEN